MDIKTYVISKKGNKNDDLSWMWPGANLEVEGMGRHVLVTRLPYPNLSMVRRNENGKYETLIFKDDLGLLKRGLLRQRGDPTPADSHASRLYNDYLIQTPKVAV